MKITILETERLLLRTTEIEDTKILHPLIFCNEHVVKHTFGQEIKNIHQTQYFIKQNCNFKTDLGLSTLIEKSSGKIIGLAGILECDYLGEYDYEFGFILAQEFWNKGYATEIGEAQIYYAENFLNARRVLALAHEDNMASIKCIENLGLTFVSTVLTKDRGNRQLYAKEF